MIIDRRLFEHYQQTFVRGESKAMRNANKVLIPFSIWDRIMMLPALVTQGGCTLAVYLTYALAGDSPHLTGMSLHL